MKGHGHQAEAPTAKVGALSIKLPRTHQLPMVSYGAVSLNWKLPAGHFAFLSNEELLGADTLSVIEILGFDGSNDFDVEANASQPAGNSSRLRVTLIPFT